MKPLVYISSPYSHGDREANARRNMSCAVSLIESGYVTPVTWAWAHWAQQDNPHGEEFWLGYDLELLEKCHAVYLLNFDFNDWFYSDGCSTELLHAEKLRIPVFADVYSLNEWAKKWTPSK